MTLVEICEPLFQYICKLNRLGRAGGGVGPRQVRDELKGILSDLKARADRSTLWIAATPALALIGVVMALPLADMVIISFRRESFGQILPGFTWVNYAGLLGEAGLIGVRALAGRCFKKSLERHSLPQHNHRFYLLEQ